MIAMKPLLLALAACCGMVDTSPIVLLLAAEQHDPKNLTVSVGAAQVNTFRVTLAYTLPGGPDSVITTVQQGGAVIAVHRLRPVTRDSFELPKPPVGQTFGANACVQSKRRGLLSNQTCQPFGYTTQDQPPPPPVIDTVRTDTTTTPLPPSGSLFFDDFRTGSKASAQNGYSWTFASCGATTTGDVCPRVVPDATNPSGFSLAFTFGGGALGDDAWSEQNMKLADPTALHVCIEWGIPANYVHRSDAASNNKGFRVFGGKAAGVSRDSAYKDGITAGWSTYPSGGKSLNQPEHGWPGGGGVGPFNTGNGGLVFVLGTIERHGFYAQVGTFQGTLGHWEGANYIQPTGDGVLRTWLNGVLTYDKTTLPLFRTGYYNRWQYAYILGWANSGFTQTTTILLRWIQISLSPIAGCTT